MKKSKFRKKLKAFFWLVFLGGVLWVSFAPHYSPTPPPYSVTVKVKQAPTALPPKPQESASSEPPQEEPLLGYEAVEPPPPSITVPVTPEPVEEIPQKHSVKIAIVIDDMGADMRSSRRAIQLPAPITLSFLPYSTRTREQATEARNKGHEILLHMPMEPIGHENPGPGALLVELPLPDLEERVQNALSSFTGFDGINNHMGSKFTAFEGGMGLVIDHLQERHLFFLDSNTSPKSIGLKTARERGLPSIGRDVFLDDDPTPEAIRKQLEVTERIARRKGAAVAIGHPHEATIDTVQAWAAEAKNRGIELVPVRELVYPSNVKQSGIVVPHPVN